VRERADGFLCASNSCRPCFSKNLKDPSSMTIPTECVSLTEHGVSKATGYYEVCTYKLVNSVIPHITFCSSRRSRGHQYSYKQQGGLYMGYYLPARSQKRKGRSLIPCRIATCGEVSSHQKYGIRAEELIGSSYSFTRVFTFPLRSFVMVISSSRSRPWPSLTETMLRDAVASSSLPASRALD
jgi:hypothetical protein